MVNLSAVLFVLGIAGLALVVGLYRREEDEWQKAADVAFLEQKEAIASLYEPKTPAGGSYQHTDNRKYIAEAGGCVLVLVLAAVVRYRSPRLPRAAEPVRVAEKWSRGPTSRQPKPNRREPAERREKTAPIKSQPELADRLSAVVWGDRVAHKETMTG